MSTTNNGFDRLPPEIIFMIFNYLSSNEIISTFFDFNERFHKFLLHYLKRLEFPTINFDIWESILPIIASQIESLSITEYDLSFPFDFLTNIKYLIISVPTIHVPDNGLNTILDKKQFQNLRSLKMTRNPLFSSRFYENFLYDRSSILKRVFNDQSLIEIFQSPPIYQITVGENPLTANIHLHSLTLTLRDFHDIFQLISFAPNLEYLNVQCQPPVRYKTSMNTINTKLKKFYLTLRSKDRLLQNYPNTYRRIPLRINITIECVKAFSSSITCLSLNLVDSDFAWGNDIEVFPIKLQQSLETMTKLNQFHFYVKLPHSLNNSEDILSQFQDQYWFDHQWFFGMHGRYLYTLPFHFDYLREFNRSYNDIQSTNNDILINNPRIWHHIKSIQIFGQPKNEKNLVKELKMKMPKLKQIQFVDDQSFTKTEKNLLVFDDNRTNESNVTLDNVTTIELCSGSIEYVQQWIKHILPNLNHLILSSQKFSSNDLSFLQLSNNRIKRLDINSDDALEVISSTNNLYFSDVQHINVCFDYVYRTALWYAKKVMKILRNFQRLNKLVVYKVSTIPTRNKQNLNHFFLCLDLNDIRRSYLADCYQEYCLFIKK